MRFALSLSVFIFVLSACTQPVATIPVDDVQALVPDENTIYAMNSDDGIEKEAVASSRDEYDRLKSAMRLVITSHNQDYPGDPWHIAYGPCTYEE